MSRAGLLRLFHTLRYLRVEQLAGQVRHRVRQRLVDPSRHPAAAPPIEGPLARCPLPAGSPESVPEGDRIPNPQGTPNDPAAIQSGDYTFLNQTHTLGFPPTDWLAGNSPKLWQYNLHYHEWLCDLPFPEARMTALHWIRQHPLERGAVGWEPYPTSLRLQNWCALFFGRYRVETLVDRDLADAIWRSIAQQTTWLRDRLEWHLMGNHLLENAIALCVVGATFEAQDSPARAWLDHGLTLLEGQLREQMLPDGMHFELSPMYHVRVSYGLLLLLSLKHPRLDALVRPYAERALRPLVELQHPDGDIPLFGDSALGVYPRPGVLLDWAARLGLERPSPDPGPWVLPEAGYVGFRNARGDNVFLADLGPLGPDHIPGHAHGDFGTWEASRSGRRVVVDSGLGTYEAGSLRASVRSTTAHNTVETLGEGQADFWGAFRLGRRGQAINPPILSRSSKRLERSDAAEKTCIYVFSGDFRCPDGTRHTRSFTVENERLTGIDDELVARRPRRFAWRLHLAPGWQFSRAEAGDPWKIVGSAPRWENPFEDSVFPQGESEVLEAHGTESYGVVRAHQVLRITREGKAATFVFRLVRSPLEQPSQI